MSTVTSPTRPCVIVNRPVSFPPSFIVQMIIGIRPAPGGGLISSNPYPLPRDFFAASNASLTSVGGSQSRLSILFDFFSTASSSSSNVLNFCCCAVARPSTPVSVCISALAYSSRVGLPDSDSQYLCHFSSKPSADPKLASQALSHCCPLPISRMN